MSMQSGVNQFNRNATEEQKEKYMPKVSGNFYLIKKKT